MEDYTQFAGGDSTTPRGYVLLWLTHPASRPPQAPPSLRWACLTVAKLGGFTDTQRTGRPGWDTLWHGWVRLQERIEGVRLAKKMTLEM
jgi:hypothetical protein